MTVGRGGWRSRVLAGASADRRSSGRVGGEGSKGATAGAGESDRQWSRYGGGKTHQSGRAVADQAPGAGVYR